MAARGAEPDRLRSVEELTRGLLDLVAPFVRYDHPQGRLALSAQATRPRVADASGPSWSASNGAARVELQAAAGGAPATLSFQPGRLVLEDGFATLRTRCRAEGAEDAAAHAAELLDGLFGYVKRSREPAPETRLHAGALVWERPVSRCEVLLVVERSLGKPLAGEIPFRFADDRIVLELSGQEDGRWETTGGLGVFDPWPFAVWLERRHLKLQRPALRVAIEPERAGRRRGEAVSPPDTARGPRKARPARRRSGSTGRRRPPR